MLAETNKRRLEKEILNLIKFISKGRDFFFDKTGLSYGSSDNWFDHFLCKELFSKYPELVQLELNIQLLYVKLSSYYQLISSEKKITLIKPRNAFAHELTDLIFNKRVRYNFFFHKVTENFKKIQFIFYEEVNGETEKQLVTNLDLELDTDINYFFKIIGALK